MVNSQITLLLVDDHRALREALMEMLQREADFQVVGEAGNAAEAIALAKAKQPDVAVVDVSMPDLDGSEITRCIKDSHPSTHVIGFSMHVDAHQISRMLKCGAEGYVAKTASKKELMEGIRAVAAGESYLCKETSAAMADRFRLESVENLSDRESEVLRLIAEGMRTYAIAEKLHISAATVEVHRRNIMRKLNLHSSVELTRYAIRVGLVSP